MIKQLITLADLLDQKGLYKEADELDQMTQDFGGQIREVEKQIFELFESGKNIQEITQQLNVPEEYVQKEIEKLRKDIAKERFFSDPEVALAAKLKELFEYAQEQDNLNNLYVPSNKDWSEENRVKLVDFLPEVLAKYKSSDDIDRQDWRQGEFIRNYTTQQLQIDLMKTKSFVDAKYK